MSTSELIQWLPDTQVAFCEHENTSVKLFMQLDAKLQTSRQLLNNPTAANQSKAYEYLSDAVYSIPLVNPRSLDRQSQQQILSKFSGLAALAASSALAVRRSPYEAICLLEHSRNLTNGQLLDYRCDISHLAKQHPTLAQQFEALRARLDATLNSGIPQPQTIHARYPIAIELEKVLNSIRRLPGFENYLGMPTEAELKALARGGTVVAVNVSELRSDALFITSSGVYVLPLPQLGFAEAKSYMATWVDEVLIQPFSLGTAAKFNAHTRRILSWLWTRVVEPVLLALGLLRPDHPSSTVPRVWWIGVGVMSRAPFHAATEYIFNFSEMVEENSTLNYCIPSYTPTIKSLKYLIAPNHQAARDHLILVTMPATPGMSTLAGINMEANMLQTCLQKRHLGCNLIPYPSPDVVRGEMKKHNLIHFACHGEVDVANPSKSHLCLTRAANMAPTGRRELERFYVHDIMSTRVPAGKLAYLSACFSAVNGTRDLADEVTHIASAFQLAGFEHVIGTLWQAMDDSAVVVAEAFYKSWFDRYGGRKEWVPTAWREAVLTMRQKSKKMPLRWAAFIHIGP